MTEPDARPVEDWIIHTEDDGPDDTPPPGASVPFAREKPLVVRVYPSDFVIGEG